MKSRKSQTITLRDLKIVLWMARLDLQAHKGRKENILTIRNFERSLQLFEKELKRVGAVVNEHVPLELRELQK